MVTRLTLILLNTVHVVGSNTWGIIIRRVYFEPHYSSRVPINTAMYRKSPSFQLIITGKKWLWVKLCATRTEWQTISLIFWSWSLNPWPSWSHRKVLPHRWPIPSFKLISPIYCGHTGEKRLVTLELDPFTLCLMVTGQNTKKIFIS